ncbi:MAG: hypothetical protein J5872_01915, partial [Lachnospiraceae bacterium]|nr:hypothetical protein [Lachnospiraceae bacterium]
SFRGSEAAGEAVKLPEETENSSVKEAAVTETDVTQVKRPFTTFRWLGLLLLLLIPPYGWIAFLVIALISAFGANATDERRAFAKAFLIFSVILIVLACILIYSNPELMNQYMEQYNKTLQEMQSKNK